jgi:hypothetical protein
MTSSDRRCILQATSTNRQLSAQPGNGSRRTELRGPPLLPHQFRTRNDLIKAQRTRTKSNENTAKSTKLIDILPLITVWLQVRVLPGQPAFARFASFGLASRCHKRPAKPAKAVTPKPAGRRRTGAASSARQAIGRSPSGETGAGRAANQNIENNPMQSSMPVAAKERRPHQHIHHGALILRRDQLVRRDTL